MLRTVPGDELHNNMETISQELNELMMEEREHVMCNNLQCMIGASNIVENPREFDGNMQHIASPIAANFSYWQSRPDLVHQVGGGAVANVNLSGLTCGGQTHYYGGSMYMVRPSVYSRAGYVADAHNYQPALSKLAYLNGNKNYFELNNHRAGKADSQPLLYNKSHGSFGAFKKHNRFYTRNIAKLERNYDKIIVNLKKIGLQENGKEPNSVLRIFSLFRKFHNALAATPKSIEQNVDSSAYEKTFISAVKVKMPRTMCVQVQVKYTLRCLALFTSNIKQILDKYRMCEQKLVAEFHRNLQCLNDLVYHLECFRKLEMEHKGGQFIGAGMEALAESLEDLLDKITRQVRDIRTRIIAFEWYIDVKYYGHHIEKIPLARIDNGQETKVGIVNEILQMCNTMTSLDIQPEPEKLDPTMASASETSAEDLMFSETTVDDHNNQLQHHKFFSPFCAGATPLKGDAIIGSNFCKTATNSRQPVFYIG